MPTLSTAARTLLDSDALAHVVTLNPDGSPQVTCVWVGLDGEEVVFASLGPWKKLQNLARDSWIVLSMQGAKTNPMGLVEYLVIEGTARLTTGGGADLLQRLAHTYLGPDVTFPGAENPPPGTIVHITIDKIGGVGRWAED